MFPPLPLPPSPFGPAAVRPPPYPPPFSPPRRVHAQRFVRCSARRCGGVFPGSALRIHSCFFFPPPSLLLSLPSLLCPTAVPPGSPPPSPHVPYRHLPRPSHKAAPRSVFRPRSRRSLLLLPLCPCLPLVGSVLQPQTKAALNINAPLSSEWSACRGSEFGF